MKHVPNPSHCWLVNMSPAQVLGAHVPPASGKTQLPELSQAVAPQIALSVLQWLMQQLPPASPTPQMPEWQAASELQVAPAGRPPLVPPVSRLAPDPGPGSRRGDAGAGGPGLRELHAAGAGASGHDDEDTHQDWSIAHVPTSLLPLSLPDPQPKLQGLPRSLPKINRARV